jgi:hypothetical protein
VFAHPQTGARIGVDRYREQLQDALKAADIPDRERIGPFHDARHAGRWKIGFSRANFPPHFPPT